MSVKNIKTVKEFTYNGTNHENRIMIVKFMINEKSIYLKLIYKEHRFVVLSKSKLERYNLVIKINKTVKTKVSQKNISIILFNISKK